MFGWLRRRKRPPLPTVCSGPSDSHWLLRFEAPQRDGSWRPIRLHLDRDSAALMLECWENRGGYGRGDHRGCSFGFCVQCPVGADAAQCEHPLTALWVVQDLRDLRVMPLREAIAQP